MEHLTIEKMYSYMEKQEAPEELGAIEGHLATCDRCHSLYVQLKSVERHLGKSFTEERASSSCPEDWELAALIQDELTEQEGKKITHHLGVCSYCIDRAAVYYKSLHLQEAPFRSPEQWKQKALGSLKVEYVKNKHKSLIIERFNDFVDGLRIPVPVAAGYATALLVVAILAWITVPDRDRFITLAGSEKLTVRSSEIPSAFGFGGAGETKELKGMNISIKGEDIVFHWKPLEGVEEYAFSLKEGNRLLKSKMIVREPKVALRKDFLEKEILYTWLITGTSKDSMYLEYTGDFLYAK